MHADVLSAGMVAAVRLVVFATHALLFGVAPILLLVTRPAFAEGGAGLGLERDRVARALQRVMVWAIVLAIAATTVGLYAEVLVAAQAGSRPVTAETVEAVAASTFGQWQVLRLPLCAALAVALWGRVAEWALLGAGDSRAGPPRRWWGGWLTLSLALLGTISLSGHAAGTDRPVLAVANDVVHLAAGATWLTGIIMLTLILPVGWRGAGAGEQLKIMAPAADRLSSVAFWAVLVVATTGVVNSLLHVAAASDFIDTAYGRALSVKLCAFVCIIALGALNHYVHRKRLLDARARGAPTPHLSKLRRAIAAELLLGVAILGATSLLVGFQPPAR